MTELSNHENYKDIINSMLMYFIFFCCKTIIKFLIRLYSSSHRSSKSTSSNNSNSSTQAHNKPIDKRTQFIEQIKKLKEEAELHNTPSEFVLHTKLERQIAKLEKELKQKSTNIPLGSIKSNETPSQSMQSDIPSFLPSNLPMNFDIKSIAIEVIFWCISTILFLSARKTSLTILYEKYQHNVIVNYYHITNDDYVHIPFNLILFCESMALNQLRKIGNKLII